MKQTIELAVCLVLITVLSFLAGRWSIKIDHRLTECRYEGRECPNYNQCKGHLLRDYQIDLHNDTVRVYDGERLVDTYLTTWKNQIDTILINDNQ